MFLSYWTLGVALSLSLVAAWYSIVGLTAIFATAVIPIIIMGTILEVAKVSVTVWLHEYWNQCRLAMKIYLVPAVVLLMIITSMGIFGFLSKAHLDQAVPTGDVAAQVSLFDEKIKTQRDNIEAARSALRQMDAAVDQTLSRSADEKGADKAAALRRQQGAERNRLQADIARAQTEIARLNEQRAPAAAELRKVEAEVGPIKYIAALIYGDNSDANLLERAVRWVIIVLVIVFDPLAIMMVLAATESLKWEREKRQHEQQAREDRDSVTYDEFERSLTEGLKLEPEPEPTGYVPGPWPFPVEKEPENILSPDVQYQVLDDADDEDEVDLDRAEKEARQIWKANNPHSTIKSQRKLYESGAIDRLPWEDLKLHPDNQEITQGEVGFGTQFPSDPRRGDMFLRVDQMPTVLFKYNGANWIEVDKDLSDRYAYDVAYIDFLIDKLKSGEYDIDMLNNTERDQVESRLNKST